MRRRCSRLSCAVLAGLLATVAGACSAKENERTISAGSAVHVDGWTVQYAAASPDLQRIAASGVGGVLLVLSPTGKVLAKASSEISAESFVWLPNGEDLLLAYSKHDDLAPGPTYFAVLRGSDLSVKRSLELLPGQRLVGNVAIDATGELAYLGSQPSILETRPARLFQCRLRDNDCSALRHAGPTLGESDPTPLGDGQLVVLVTRLPELGKAGASWLARRRTADSTVTPLTPMSGGIAAYAVSEGTVYVGRHEPDQFGSPSFTEIDALSGRAQPSFALQRIAPTAISATGDVLLAVTASGEVRTIRPHE